MTKYQFWFIISQECLLFVNDVFNLISMNMSFDAAALFHHKEAAFLCKHSLFLPLLCWGPRDILFRQLKS